MGSRFPRGFGLVVDGLPGLPWVAGALTDSVAFNALVQWFSLRLANAPLPPCVTMPFPLSGIVCLKIIKGAGPAALLPAAKQHPPVVSGRLSDHVQQRIV